MTESSFAPALLLSMPQMHDPNFAQTVVLLCEHNEDGAFGLVINRPITTTARVVSQEEPEDVQEHELEVWVGGPVEPERSWILLHDEAVDERAIRICDGVYLSTSASVLKRIIDRSADPRTRLVAGYAGWGPGQLEAEVNEGAWFPFPARPDDVMTADPEDLWATVLERGGADHRLMATMPSDPSMN